MPKAFTLVKIIAVSLILLTACNGSEPLAQLKQDLKNYPEYSIILADMKREGNFFKSYFHRYKYVYAEKDAAGDSLVFKTGETDWEEVDKGAFRSNENDLGMILASKAADGKVSDDRYPPGYQYVGNEQYGQWRQRSDGTSFWEFYGKYALFRSMFGMYDRPVFQSDYRNYQDYRRRSRPYYGQDRAYGTTGTQTKKSQPNFYERRAARERASKSRFSDRVRERTRRSNMSRVRSRSSRSRGGK